MQEEQYVMECVVVEDEEGPRKTYTEEQHLYNNNNNNNNNMNINNRQINSVENWPPSFGNMWTGEVLPLNTFTVSVSQEGTLAVTLGHNILAELTIGGNVRLCQLGSIAAGFSLDGPESVAAIHHPAAEIVLRGGGWGWVGLMSGTEVRLTPDGAWINGVQPVLPIAEADLPEQCVAAESAGEATNPASSHFSPMGLFSIDQPDSQQALIAFPHMDQDDTTVGTFFEEAEYASLSLEERLSICMEIASRVSIYHNWVSQHMTVSILGYKIRQNLATGETRVYGNDRFLSLKPHTKTVTVRRGKEEVTVESWDKGLVKMSTGYNLFIGETLGLRVSGWKASFDHWGRPFNTHYTTNNTTSSIS